MRESAVRFGRETVLLGVVSEPPPETDYKERPAILLLNAGLIHRVGPGRLYVRLARALAEQGFLTMRFDLPGRGDSEVRRAAESIIMASLVDVQAAMDHLEQTKGVTRFILAGICSGAAGAAEAARVAPRVVGTVLINPYSYPTLQSRIRYYVARLGKARSWWNTLTGRNRLGRTLRRALRGQGTNDDDMLNATSESGAFPRQAAAGMLRDILNNDVRMCVIFSASPGYNYRRQFEDAFSDVDFQDKLAVEYFPEADHTFTRLISQQRLQDSIVRWVRRKFDPEQRGPSVERSRAAGEPDRSGRDRLAWNLVWSWGGHLVFVAAGFVIPRLIDRELGQAHLGVWDFCWSLVNYFTLAQIGIGASVNRHVAAHRAVGDVAALNRTASSVMAVQLLAAGLVLAVTATAVALLPAVFADRLGDAVGEARWIVALLGGTTAVHMALHVYRGVLTGCHRWDLTYKIDSAFQALSAIAMTMSLLFGAGLPALAAIVFTTQTLSEVARALATYRVCPELEIRRRYATLAEARDMLVFGGKLSIAAVAEIVLVQTNSLLVMSHLGVNALALYARPNALLRHVSTLSKKLSLALVPTAGSLQSSGRYDELRELLENGTRYASILLMPILLLLAIMGDPILELWMGPDYRQGLVLAVLALGSLLPLTQHPSATILVGMNRHGVLAVASMATAAVGLAVTVLTIGSFGWGLLGAAVSIAGASTVVGVVIPIAACRALHVPFARYLRRGYAKPLVAMIPFTAVLLTFRVLATGRPVLQVCGGAAAGAVVLAPLYWRWFVPQHIRQRIVKKAAAFRRRDAVPVGVQSISGRPGE